MRINLSAQRYLRARRSISKQVCGAGVHIGSEERRTREQRFIQTAVLCCVRWIRIITAQLFTRSAFVCYLASRTACSIHLFWRHAPCEHKCVCSSTTLPHGTTQQNNCSVCFFRQRCLCRATQQHSLRAHMWLSNKHIANLWHFGRNLATHKTRCKLHSAPDSGLSLGTRNRPSSHNLCCHARFGTPKCDFGIQEYIGTLQAWRETFHPGTNLWACRPFGHSTDTSLHLNASQGNPDCVSALKAHGARIIRGTRDCCAPRFGSASPHFAALEQCPFTVPTSPSHSRHTPRYSACSQLNVVQGKVLDGRLSVRAGCCCGA